MSIESWAERMAAEVSGTAAATAVSAPSLTVPPGEHAPIRVDMRETALKAALGVAHASAALHVADVWIGCSGETIAPNGILLERKTVADFDASLKDARYREQKQRLLTHAQETGSRVAYVVEGDVSRSSLGPRALHKLIARNELIYGIPVFRVKNVQETAALVELLYGMWAAGDFGDGTAAAAERRITSTYGIHVVKKENNADPRTHALNVLCQCPGVSAKIAEAWLDGCGGSLRQVIDSSADTLANMKVGTRRVGPAVAGRFAALWAAAAAADPLVPLST